MKPIIGFFLLFLAGVSASLEREMVAASAEEPVFKVLFESGYYTEAIEYLNAKLVDSTDTSRTDYLRYLGSSYAMAGDSARAVDAFRRMLDLDSLVRLDSISAPPRIFAAFIAARLASEDAIHSPPVSLPILRKDIPPIAEIKQEKRVNGTALAIYLMPGGAGQFYNRQYRKGTLLMCLQGLGLASSLWAYQQRQQLYDPDRGWYSENADAGLSYLRYGQIHFGLFCGSYLYSIIDAVVHGQRR